MSNARFSIIPAWVVTHPRMKGSDLKVLCLLGTYTNKEGWCRRSQVKMAEQLGCGRSTVQDSLNRLSEIGAVEKRRVDSPDGRDSAHWYRVVLDRATASDAFFAYDDDDEKEFGPIKDADFGATPAGIPAPPAGPGAAPPAGSGPAPINESSLTENSNGKEREAREASEKSEEEENPAASERRFKRFFIGWKTAVNDSEFEARSEWRSLSPSERLKALELSEAYQTAALTTGRKYLCSASRYLKEKRWERLSDLKLPEKAGHSATETYTAYSRAGRGLLLAELLRPARNLVLNRVEETIIADNPDKSDMIWRDKLEKQGWPEACRLIETTLQRRKFSVPFQIINAAQDFDKVKVGGQVWEAWRRLHHRRCWPWLPPPGGGVEYVPFPRFIGEIETDEDLDQAVEAALMDFSAKLSEVRGNDDAIQEG